MHEHERFVGRDAELMVVAELLERARAARPRPLLVTGASGTGKSMLLQRLAADAEARGFRALRVRGEQLDGARPFEALGDAILAWAVTDGGLPGDVLASLRTALAPDAPIPAADRRVAITEATRHLLETAAARQPVLVVVDDLDLVDDETAALAVFLMRHVRRHRVLIAVTARAEPDAAACLDDLWRAHIAGQVALLELEPFDADELTALVAAHLGRQPDERFVRSLRERTGGLPFFAAELVAALASNGVVQLADGRVTIAAEPALPRRVATTVLHRVFQLGADARHLAAAVAVLGPIRLDHLDAVAMAVALPTHRTDAAFDRLVRARILVADAGSYRFAHAIVRDALRADVGPAAGRALHGALGRALAASRVASGDPAAEEIARHVRAGTSGHDRAAAALLAEAGDEAMWVAPGRAASWFGDALARLAPDDPLVLDVQVRLSRALALDGRAVEADRVARAVLRAVPRGDRWDRAAVVAAHAAMANGAPERAAELLDDALTRRRAGGARLLERRALLHVAAHDVEAADHLLAEAVAMGRPHDDPFVVAVRMRARAAAGDVSEAARLAAVLRRPEAAVASPGARVHCALAVTTLAALALDPRDALGAEHAAIGEGPMAAWFAAAMAWAHLRAGQLERAVDAAATAMRRRPAMPEDQLIALVAPVLVVAHAERGDVAGADVTTSRWSERPSPLGIALATACARASWMAGDTRRAAALLDQAERQATTLGRVGPLAGVLAERIEVAAEDGDEVTARATNERLQALAGDRADVAVGMHCLLGDALARRDAASARAARTYASAHGLQLDAARAAALEGRWGADASTLGLARDEMARLGATARRRRVETAMRDLGRHTPRPRPAAGALLTAVEVEVAALVARGLTNRQVAEQVHLSPKTVEVYLTRIYAKTGCRSRVELAVAYHADRDGAPSAAQ